MRTPVKQAGPASLRAARPTPNYEDEITEEYIAKQSEYIKVNTGYCVELTPIGGDAW